MAWPNGTYRVSDKTTGNGTGYLEVLPDFAQDMASMVSYDECTGYDCRCCSLWLGYHRP
jgi:hypothetical protein